MSVELKSKTSESASKMLKSAETNDKLQSSDGGSKSTLKAGLRETFDITENSARRHARNNAQKYYNEDLSLASEALLGTNEDKVINLTNKIDSFTDLDDIQELTVVYVQDKKKKLGL